jgi:hypothetical protein
MLWVDKLWVGLVNKAVKHRRCCQNVFKKISSLLYRSF